jgi:hypothetical protein
MPHVSGLQAICRADENVTTELMYPHQSIRRLLWCLHCQHDLNAHLPSSMARWFDSWACWGG